MQKITCKYLHRLLCCTTRPTNSDEDVSNQRGDVGCVVDAHLR